LLSVPMSLRIQGKGKPLGPLGAEWHAVW
jgi:hypothetical protein